MPPGYMPAAFGEGGPVSLCPMGLPAGLLPEHSGPHHEDEESRGADLLWEYCPLGTLTDTGSIVAEIHFQLPVFQQARPNLSVPSAPASVARLGFRSRAPPTLAV